jgi:hypothetical protein
VIWIAEIAGDQGSDSAMSSATVLSVQEDSLERVMADSLRAQPLVSIFARFTGSASPVLGLCTPDVMEYSAVLQYAARPPAQQTAVTRAFGGQLA